MKIYNLDLIKRSITLPDDLYKLLDNQKSTFIDYSRGLINIPLPMQFEFNNPFGDCHVKGANSIKYDSFVIKVSSGFYSPAPSGDGVILFMSSKTGTIEAIFYDKGYLTLLRTALVACLAAQLTPFVIKRIGIIGNGNLGSKVVQLLKILYPQEEIMVWGRDFKKSQDIAIKYDIRAARDIKESINDYSLIITTTASPKAILMESDIKYDNLHIIGLGADCIGKQELDSKIFNAAPIIIVDSKKQALQFGDTYNAIKTKNIHSNQLIELGDILDNKIKLEENNNFLISNFTGIGAQDLAISQYIYYKITQRSDITKTHC